MDIEISSQLLKNIVSSLLTIQPEINLIITSSPPKIQFVISKIEGFMYWAIDAIIVNNTSDYVSITIMIDKLVKTLITESEYSCKISTTESALILEQYSFIRNCLSGGNRISDVKINTSLHIPYVINHPSLTEYIFDYNKYKEGIDPNALKTAAIFKHKLFEQMINTCLDISKEAEVSISNGIMFFKAESIEDKFFISSPVLGHLLPINKRLELSSMNYIKTYRKICDLVSVEIILSHNTYYLSIKPISSKPCDTELVLSFI